ncbi:hypothetical protein Cs7R123_18450 [Catellatospora sp. TT07R-123]|uniref:hypothetical protein n=1 Tax=Catellatospora sp. TT07R-123 TaxID=2733863 RepID=UPI001B14EB9C|nr:hypothetical protein [Catellatospora sp. TT07R-123]GHJ44503.1 hypothetical protein Cs7R123_18450 [Catellatospora sp. TT07R-123]
MTRDWRRGSIRLIPGYHLLNAAGLPVAELAEVDFALEGGFVNVRVPGRDDVQLVSAPALHLITCPTR